MINLLYICTPSSIHDQKWISFFSQQKTLYNVFVLFEEECELDEATRNRLEALEIKLLEPVRNISIFSLHHVFTDTRRIRKLMIKYKIDLVHILFATPFALWGNVIDIPYLITTRGSDVLVVLPQLLDQRGIKGVYFNYLFKLFQRAFQKSKTITATSRKQVNYIKENLSSESEIVLIRTGVEVEQISQMWDNSLLDECLQNKKYIISPRFMSPTYNTLFQIEAMELLPKDVIREYLFVFIRGKKFDPQYAQRVEAKLEELKEKIGLQYLVKEYLSQKELWMYLKKASLTMMTPISDGTPNTALEAMASKCPLIISDLSYDEELFTETCLKADINDAHTLTTLICKSLEAYPEELINNAFERVQRFGSRKNEMNKLERLYHKILGLS